MHELSIALSLIDVASEEAERLGGRVVAIHLSLGPLSGVVTEALQSAFELAREETPLAEAKLIVREVPIIAWCPACECERKITSPQRLCCPICETPTPDVRGGRELEVTGLEILDGLADAHGGSSAEGAEAE